MTSLPGPVVGQKWGGTRIYDVKDIGTAMGHGVHRSITNLSQECHTNGGWLTQTPKIIAMTCLRQAEHPKGEPKCSRHPVYAWSGNRRAVRYYDDYIRQGHQQRPSA